VFVRKVKVVKKPKFCKCYVLQTLRHRRVFCARHWEVVIKGVGVG
jgi:hypothetical protein